MPDIISFYMHNQLKAQELNSEEIREFRKKITELKNKTLKELIKIQEEIDVKNNLIILNHRFAECMWRIRFENYTYLWVKTNKRTFKVRISCEGQFSETKSSTVNDYITKLISETDFSKFPINTNNSLNSGFVIKYKILNADRITSESVNPASYKPMPDEVYDVSDPNCKLALCVNENIFYYDKEYFEFRMGQNFKSKIKCDNQYAIQRIGSKLKKIIEQIDANNELRWLERKEN